MNTKEISELRRRFRADRSNISRVCGCFVNDQKEIISEFDQSLGMMGEDDAEQVLKTLKRTLSGTVGRNLLDVEFSTQQVLQGEEHLLLSKLRDSRLQDTESVHALYQKIISSLEIEGNFLILLAADAYDVFSYAADGEQKEESDEVFSYILCSICPIKEGKPSLSYYLPGNCFRSVCADSVLSYPALGFLFPAFDDRTTNIYGALYYTHDLTDNHKELSDALFGSPIPMPAAEQKQTFGHILEETMAEDCSLRVVRSVHGQIMQMIEEHKAEKIEEPLVMTKTDASDMLRFCGVEEEKVTSFERKFEEAFGADTALTPVNIADKKQMRVEMPDVEIKVAAGCGDLVETRMIDGKQYVLIRVDGDVTVNGVNVKI